MPLSMHQASVPVLVRQLGSLSKFLAKGEAFAEAQKIDPATLMEARLAPDMHPLTRQVQIASDAAKGGVARLAGIEAPSFPDIEKTFAELQDRVAKTKAFLETVPADKIDGSEERIITLPVGPNTMSFPGQFFLLGFVLPNFFFHMTTTYAILRHKGVELGKMDFLSG